MQSRFSSVSDARDDRVLLVCVHLRQLSRQAVSFALRRSLAASLAGFTRAEASALVRQDPPPAPAHGPAHVFDSGLVVVV